MWASVLFEARYEPQRSYYSSDRSTAKFAVARPAGVYPKVAGEANYGAMGWGVDEWIKFTKRLVVIRGRWGTAGFVVGDVVIVPFPFSDLSESKRRPALVLAVLTGDDLILCQITSQSVRDSYSIEIGDQDFVSGGLSKISNIRPNRLFTADRSIVLYKAGELSVEKLQLAINQLIMIIRSNWSLPELLRLRWGWGFGETNDLELFGDVEFGDENDG
jgi:mRNA interferase MazF